VLRKSAHCGPRESHVGLPVLLAVVLAIALAGAAGGATSAPRQQALSFKLEHFLCYSIKPSGHFQPRVVKVLDQFKQVRKTTVLGPDLLCNWASKNGSRVFDRHRHLLCYTTRSAQSFATRRVVVTNQFGNVGLAVVKPNALCLPSGKSKPGTRPILPKTLDHFQCYPVKATTTTKPRRVGVADEFGKGKYAVTRPVRLCNPARKNGSRIRDPRDHLLCYAVDPLQPPRPRTVVVANQFGGSRLVAVSAKVLCLPSLKRLLPPRRPDLTPKIDQTSLKVACTAGAGTCTTTFSFTVTNAGAAASGAFDVLATADPGQTKTLSVPGLAAGASTTLSASFGPAGNCFDPDCTVMVTADSGNVVVESNEANNTDSFTKPG
jgi:CARDB